MDKRTAVHMTIPKIGFFAQVSREVGDTYGPRSYESRDYQVPTDDHTAAEAYLREKGIRFDFFVILKRWTTTVTTALGEEIELKSDPVSNSG